MEQFDAKVFAECIRGIHNIEWRAYNAKGNEPDGTVNDADLEVMQPALDAAGMLITFFNLSTSQAKLSKLEALIAARGSYAFVETRFSILRETLEEELEHRIVYFMPPGRAVKWLYGPRLLDSDGKSDVLDTFGELATDMDEAGKCFGAGRFTASVFHLMRVMEVGVQRFGDKIGVKVSIDSDWATILKDVDTKVDAMTSKDPNRANYAEASSLLHAVKLAWRNPTMHPKSSYTEEEAERILQAVRAFMQDLATLVK